MSSSQPVIVLKVLLAGRNRRGCQRPTAGRLGVAGRSAERVRVSYQAGQAMAVVVPEG